MTSAKGSDPEKALVEEIEKNRKTGKISTAHLETDDRVLARITDGIYRQPASALRELVANSYDADAEHVYIQTDAPRFSQILVRDDGNGMSIETLSRLIHHIGGSPKRVQDGVDLGIVSKKDPALSPKGRKLIGKIGIGLFSVAQLTRHFQIITKTQGDRHRLVAEVVLNTYTEDDLAALRGKEARRVDTGVVRIRTVPAVDVDYHGTDIILMDLRHQTVELLQSKDIWDRVAGGVSEEDDKSESLAPPRYHIGRLDPANPDKIVETEKLPWTKQDKPNVRFAKLYQALTDGLEQGDRRPSLESSVDNYLRVLWTLSLSAPLDYIENHPFDLTAKDEARPYLLSAASKGQAKELDLKNETVRKVVGLRTTGYGASTMKFELFVDDVQLLRPIRFSRLPTTTHAVRHPLFFVGKAEPNLSGIPDQDRGGDLSFEAYFLWAPKIVPKEHAGILIRIGNASGTLFDETFLKYQVAELNRLRQITAEVFVIKGLDAALNIDRESFNYAHPHYQFLMKWVHDAIRQVANAEKTLAKKVRTGKRDKDHRKVIQAIGKVAQEEVDKAYEGRDEEPPDVVFSASPADAAAARKTDDTLAFESQEVFKNVPIFSGDTTGTKAKRETYEERMKAVAQILDAYGLLEKLPYKKQQSLLRAIASIFSKEGEE